MKILGWEIKLFISDNFDSQVKKHLKAYEDGSCESKCRLLKEANRPFMCGLCYYIVGQKMAMKYGLKEKKYT